MNPKELGQQELDVNLAEQNLLRQRIRLMQELLNDISSDDPHYAMMARQIKMDEVELSELKVREQNIKEKLSEH
jgi:hypothetical protein